MNAFENATASLGKAMHDFLTKVCPFFKTRELPRETESRKRRKKAAQGADVVDVTPRGKDFHLDLFKWHILIHYVFMILRYGTIEGLSTMPVRSIVLAWLRALILIIRARLNTSA